MAALVLLVAGIETVGTLRINAFGLASPPLGMARWLGEHGAPGERVFTANWADSSPLFYCAPQLQSLVALDPTVFYLKDPQLFQLYTGTVAGRHPDPARAIRERFGARWVTIPWRTYRRLTLQLSNSPGVRSAFKDRDYLVMDLGATAPAAPRAAR